MDGLARLELFMMIGLDRGLKSILVLPMIHDTLTHDTFIYDTLIHLFLMIHAFSYLTNYLLCVIIFFISARL